MSNARIGKVARLPKHIRDQLNRRLEDGEPGKELVEWLNGLPEAQEVLKWQFGGRPINEQNLTEWKQGGYLAWLQHQESCDLVRRLTEQSDDLEATADEVPVSDRFSTLLAVELARASEALLKEITDPQERWQRLRELLQELGQLRRDDHQAARLQMEQERWERETDRLEKQEHKQEIQKIKNRATAPFWARLGLGPLAEDFGGGEAGHKIAAFLLEVADDLPTGTLSAKSPTSAAQPSPAKPNQSESNPIKPDQTSGTPAGRGPGSGMG